MRRCNSGEYVCLKCIHEVVLSFFSICCFRHIFYWSWRCLTLLFQLLISTLSVYVNAVATFYDTYNWLKLFVFASQVVISMTRTRWSSTHLMRENWTRGGLWRSYDLMYLYLMPRLSREAPLWSSQPWDAALPVSLPEAGLLWSQQRGTQQGVFHKTLHYFVAFDPLFTIV